MPCKGGAHGSRASQRSRIAYELLRAGASIEERSGCDRERLAEIVLDSHGSHVVQAAMYYCQDDGKLRLAMLLVQGNRPMQ